MSDETTTHTITLEDGRTVDVAPEWGERNYQRVHGPDARVYYHVATAPDGTWLYREDETVRTATMNNPFA